MTRHVAIVTGANHGIGAATACRLAAGGTAVVVSYLRLADAPDPSTPDAYRDARAGDAGTVIEGIRDAGGDAIAVEADLVDPATAARLFDAAEAAFGPVDILVNNASGWVQDTFTPHQADRFDRPLQPVTRETFDRQFAVDARATALLIAQFAQRHVARGATWGRVVGLTSGGPQGFPDEVSYGAAKAALENYTMSAASELARYGVTANVIHPPVTDTGWVTDDIREAVERSHYQLGVAVPDDVADVIVFLCSDAARRVTGTVVRMR
jgi:3-oxoacyl-[acyl-carrier protein] reductase